MGTRVTGPVTATDWAALMSEVAVALLGKPNAALSGRRKLRLRRRGSLAMDIAGPDAGWFRDYEAGTGSGVLEISCSVNVAVAGTGRWPGFAREAGGMTFGPNPEPPSFADH